MESFSTLMEQSAKNAPRVVVTIERPSTLPPNFPIALFDEGEAECPHPKCEHVSSNVIVGFHICEKCHKSYYICLKHSRVV